MKEDSNTMSISKEIGGWFKFNSIYQKFSQWFSSDGVLGTRYTLEELEDDLDDREKALRRIEKKIENHSEAKKEYLEKAVDLSGESKVRFYSKGKREQMYKNYFQRLYNDLIKRYLFLTNVVLQAKMQKTYEESDSLFDFNVDFSEFSDEDIETSLEEASMQREEVESRMEELEVPFRVSSDFDLGLDLEDIKEEAAELEAAEIEGDVTQLQAGMDESIDEQIQSELEDLKEHMEMMDEVEEELSDYEF